MKKVDKYQLLKLHKRRWKKLLKRKRRGKTYFSRETAERLTITKKKRHDERVVREYVFPLHDFLDERGNRPGMELCKEFIIPKIFSLEHNYNESLLTIALIRNSLFKYIGGTFLIDFKDCSQADFSALFSLSVILNEYIKALRKLDQRLLYHTALPTIHVRSSSVEKVNFNLLAHEFIPAARLSNQCELIPISMLKLIRGEKNQKHYSENKKGSAATKIRRYIDESLRRHQFELNPLGVNYLDGIISEILNNAEDHSLFDSWYAYGNLFESINADPNTELVGEINLAFLNFGYSIYEGFEATKVENNNTYSEMDQLTKDVQQQSQGRKFTRENLFTLYALQDGSSRLKYERESRGTGTMKFINSFLNLGDYEDKTRGFTPHLMIYSGSTMLKCDNTYKPFSLDGAFFLSLNPQSDLKVPPISTHLLSLDYRFPGTLITGKIYLNEKHLRNKLDSNEG